MADLVFITTACHVSTSLAACRVSTSLAAMNDLACVATIGSTSSAVQRFLTVFVQTRNLFVDATCRILMNFSFLTPIDDGRKNLILSS